MTATPHPDAASWDARMRTERDLYSVAIEATDDEDTLRALLRRVQIFEALADVARLDGAVLDKLVTDLKAAP